MPRSDHSLNPSCEACCLYEHAKSVCLKGKNVDGHRPLAIFTSHPDYFADNAGRGYVMDSGKILDNILLRMSVNPSDVAYEYVLRCYPKKSLPTTKAGRADCFLECNRYRFASIAKLRPKAIVVLGGTAFEAFTGKSSNQLKHYAERQVRAWEPVVGKHCSVVWVGYTLELILLKSAADTVSTARTIWQAAEQAGLRPKINPQVKPFEWQAFL